MPTVIVNTALKAKAKVRPGLDKAWPWRLHHCDARKLSACYDGARDVVDSRHLWHFITTSDRHTNNHICVSPSPLVDGLTRRRRLCQTTAFCRHSNTRCYSRTRSSFGDRTFAAAGPLTIWNSLPPNLRLCELSYGNFRRLLKTYLFGQCELLNFAEYRNILTLTAAVSWCILLFCLSLVRPCTTHVVWMKLNTAIEIGKHVSFLTGLYLHRNVGYTLADVKHRYNTIQFIFDSDWQSTYQHNGMTGLFTETNRDELQRTAVG